MFYLSYAGYEVRKWLRDPLVTFIMWYPLLLGLLARMLVPLAADRTGGALSAYYHVILATLAVITPRVAGALAAFSILDDRDDNILYSVQVAPLSLEFFIGFKLAMVYVLGFLGSVFVLWFSDLVELPAGVTVAVALLSSFGGPISALLINYVSSNKVEGFAALKGLNLLVVFPIAALLMFDKKEFLFSFEPGFWPAKALSVAIINRDVFQLSYSAYYLVGLVYAIVATTVAYVMFKRRVQR